MHRRAPIASLLCLAAFAILCLPANAITLTHHIVKPHGITAKADRHVVVVRTVAPPDRDDDGCPDSKDSYNGPGCNAPEPPVAAPVAESVAPATPVYSSVAAPVDINCESGGDYSINTGNGYYGAYQFDSGTWDAYGDPAYPEASDAPPAVQDAAAASVPYDAWPNC